MCLFPIYGREKSLSKLNAKGQACKPMLDQLNAMENLIRDYHEEKALIGYFVRQEIYV